MNDFLLPVTGSTLFNAACMVLGFVGLLFAGAIALPGVVREGYPIPPEGNTRTYKLNGLALFFATHVVMALGILVFGWSMSALLAHFWSLLIVTNVLAVGATAWLYFRGFAQEDEVGHDETSPVPAFVQHVWLGTQRNPTLCGVDLKMFAYQPSLIGLGVLQFAFAFRQYELYDTVSPQMLLYLGFWWAYLFTHYIKEAFMLSTWDIIAERFGFMLVWGDLVYVPYFYSLCGWYLIDSVEPWSVFPLMLLTMLHVVGHWIFRESNWQKARFKRDRDCLIWGEKAELLGDRLLISGWWGVGRKINYTGEIIVYLTFALCAGFSSVVPYILPISLVGLLVHRAWRDDQKCRQKYGALWDEYCEHARFKIFPGIY